MATMLATDAAHNKWLKITTPTAKCDFCSKKNSVLYRCEEIGCRIAACRPCMEEGVLEDAPHEMLYEHVKLLDWTKSKGPVTRGRSVRSGQATTDTPPASVRKNKKGKAKAKKDGGSILLSGATNDTHEVSSERGSANKGPSRPHDALGYGSDMPEAYPHKYQSSSSVDISNNYGAGLNMLMSLGQSGRASPFSMQRPSITQYQYGNSQGYRSPKLTTSRELTSAENSAPEGYLLTHAQSPFLKSNSYADHGRQNQEEREPMEYREPRKRSCDDETCTDENYQAPPAVKRKVEHDKPPRRVSIPPEWLEAVDPELLAKADDEMLDAAKTLVFMKLGGFEGGVAGPSDNSTNMEMNKFSSVDTKDLDEQRDRTAAHPATRRLLPGTRPVTCSPHIAKPQSSLASRRVSKPDHPSNCAYVSPQTTEQGAKDPDVPQWMGLMSLFGVTRAHWTEQGPNGDLTARAKRLHQMWGQVMDYVIQRFPVDKATPDMEVRFEFSWSKLLTEMGDVKPENELQRYVAQTAHNTIQQMLKNTLEEQ